jgi:hypothetical protein
MITEADIRIIVFLQAKEYQGPPKLSETKRKAQNSLSLRPTKTAVTLLMP